MGATRLPGRPRQDTASRPAPAQDDPCIWQMRPAGAGAPTVLLLAHAGGGGQSFAGWSDWFPEGIRLLAAQYPGRGPRYGEPLPDDLHGLASPLARAVQGLAGPLVIFGHSLGAIVGFELAWQLQVAGTPPEGLVASAALAPHEGNLTAGYAGALRSDGALLDMLRDTGGLPAEILASPEMCALVLEIVAGDLRMLEGYDFGRRPRVLECPIAPIGGDDDPLTPARSLWRWRELSAAPQTPRVLTGGHFYTLDHMEAVSEAVLSLVPRRRDAAGGNGRPPAPNP